MEDLTTITHEVVTPGFKIPGAAPDAAGSVGDYRPLVERQAEKARSQSYEVWKREITLGPIRWEFVGSYDLEMALGTHDLLNSHPFIESQIRINEPGRKTYVANPVLLRKYL